MKKSKITDEQKALTLAVAYIIDNSVGCDICINQDKKSCKKADCQKAIEESLLAQARKK